MTIQSGSADDPHVADVRHLRRYRVRRVAATIMAISPPILCAGLASYSGNWDLFERSGSITTAIGLLVASRRYVQFGVLELAMLQARGPAPDAREMSIYKVVAMEVVDEYLALNEGGKASNEPRRRDS
jgi:hypothetical protein